MWRVHSPPSKRKFEPMGKYDLHTATIGDLLQDPDALALIDQYAPGLAATPAVTMFRGMNLESALGMAGGFLPADKVEAIRLQIESL